MTPPGTVDFRPSAPVSFRVHRVYLVPGFFGFANLGELKYFGHVHRFLTERAAVLGVPAKFHVVKTHPTSSLPKRAVRLLETIAASAGRGTGPVHVIGHSSGGLDLRLLTAPQVKLPTDLDVERSVSRIRTLVAVVTPHRGTPTASFFASLLGQKLLQALSLSTMHVLRFGRLPVTALLKLGTILTRLDDRLLNSALLDELFDVLLADFSAGRRRAVQHLLGEVATDQALLPQLTPEAMEVFNALTRPRDGVRYGSVLALSQRPGLRSTLAAGLDPSAHVTQALYQTLYRLTANTRHTHPAGFTPSQAAALRRAYGRLPSEQANDGIVPTRSQVWGEIIHAARADHLDVLGHFSDPARTPAHYDWLTTGSGFTHEKFAALWSDVLSFVFGQTA